MKKLFKLFSLRREERLPALCAMVMLVSLHALLIARYFELFSKTGRGHWTIFIKNFLVSGFDPITYSIVTHWDTNYNVYRHPFLAFFVWPLSMLNSWIESAFGVNAAQILTALHILFCAFYAFVFLFRTFRDIIRLGVQDAFILSMMTYSFAYVMLASFVPDHFIISMFCLVFALYVCGMKIKHKTCLKTWQTIMLFFVTAGVTLSNGVKIFIDALFTNGARFFRPKYLLPAILLPSALIWGFARWEYKTFVLPKEKARHELRDKQNAERKERMFAEFRKKTDIKDSLEQRRAFNAELKKLAMAKYKADHKQPWNTNKGKPISKGEFMNWTDISTSRGETAVENLFGESIQLHKKFLLQDTLRSRPVIVPYSWLINYLIEAVIVALFVAGIWFGRRSRFLWMALSGFAFDMMLHMGLGFGINEVYIMGAHWLFVLPISMSFLVKAAEGTRHEKNLRLLIVWLTVWLLVYNGMLVIRHLT